MLSRALRAGLLGLLLVAVPGCAPIVRVESRPALAGLAQPIAVIAMAPFTPTGRLAQPRAQEGSESPSLATSLVAHQVAEALRTRVTVVPAEDIGRALGTERAPLVRLVPAEVARLAAAEYGADAVLLGEVSRFVSRSGEAAGTLRPASVGFAVSLYAAPGGQLLWRAHFDETQKALSENLFVTGRYPGRGTRWLTAEELSRWGAEATAAQLPLGP